MDSQGKFIAELSRRLREGEENSYQEFYDLYGLQLLRYLAALHQGDIDSAKDTLQMTFLRVARSIKVFKDEAVFWGWLRRVARTAFIDSQRKTIRYRRFLHRFSAEPEGELLTRDGDGLLNLVSHALEKLDPDVRTIIDAYYFQDLSYAQIGERFDLSPRAIEGRLARARARLRSLLTQAISND